MTGYVTVDRKAKSKGCTLWEERDGAHVAVSRHDRPEDVPGSDALPVWEFDLQTTSSVGCQTNQGRYPVLDKNGSPLWPGARLSFLASSHYVNRYGDDGVLVGVDMYGGCMITSDSEHPNWGRGGSYSTRGRDRYVSVGDYEHSGPHAGCRVLGGWLGDPFEHGRMPVHIVLKDDPRGVCTLVNDPSPAPGR